MALALPRPAGAAAPPARSARLQWQREPGAEGCIAGEELAAALQRRLRRGTIGGPEADVTLEGTILPAEGRPGYNAWIVVRDRAGRATGTREVASVEPSCRALDEALVLVLSVIIDPSLALEPAPAPEARPAAARVEEATTGYVAAGGVASAGLVPGLGLGVAASAGVRPWGGPVFELEAAHWFGRRVEHSDGAAAVSATHAGLNVCALPFARDRWQLGACAGAQAGVVRVDASGFGGENLAPTRPLANVAARAEARLAVAGPLFVRLTAGAALPLVRDRYFFDDRAGREASLFRLAPVVTAVGVQAGVTFR